MFQASRDEILGHLAQRIATAGDRQAAAAAIERIRQAKVDKDTVGGLVVSRFGHLPKRGEAVNFDGFNFSGFSLEAAVQVLRF